MPAPDFHTEQVAGDYWLMRQWGDWLPMRKTREGNLAFLTGPGHKADGTKERALQIIHEYQDEDKRWAESHPKEARRRGRRNPDPNTKRFTYKGNRIEVWKGNDNEGKLGYDPWHFRPVSGPGVSKINWHILGPSKTRDEAIELSKYAVDSLRSTYMPGSGRQNPGGLYGDAKTAFGYGYSAGEARGRHDESGYRFHHDSYRKWLSAYSFRQPIEVKREAEDAYAKGYEEAMSYRHRPNPGKGWFTRCMSAVSASGSASDPGAVCGAQLKKMGRRRNPWTIGSIKHANQEAGQHFFDKDTMKFFRSKVHPPIYDGPNGVYFVTSEVMEYSDRTQETKYKVRQFDPNNGHVYTHGPYARSLQEAKQMAKDLSGKRRNSRRRNLSIRKYKKGRLSGYEEATGSAVKWFRAKGSKTRAAKKRKRTRTVANPRRYILRSAGREFTVIAKSMKSAWAEVRAYLKKQGLALNSRKRNTSAKRRTKRKRNEFSPGGHSKSWYNRGARAGKSRKYSDMYDAWADYRSKYLSPSVGLGTKVTAQESFYQGYIDHAARSNKRRRRNRSVSMLVPRARRKTIKSVERRTSAALSKYLGSRRRY